MIDVRDVRSGPLVSVLVTADAATGPRPLAAALRSAIQQTYADLQVIVANDGGPDLAGVAASLGDARLELAQWPGRRGRAATLNRALAQARGRYVCYLDGRDMHHPHHVRTLVEALEGRRDCQAAYSDACLTLYRPQPDGRRQVLGKVVAEGRDFDRFLLMHRNYVAPTALMHRRDLLERAGPYNEALRVLTAWDMNRRLAMFTDFVHVPAVTAEQYATDPCLDRELEGEDLGADDLDAQRRLVRAARPPKPWPKAQDLAILYAPSRAENAAERIAEVRKLVSWPYRLYVAAEPAEARRLADSAGEGVEVVATEPSWPPDARLDKLLRSCQGECVAVVPQRARGVSLPLTSALYALLHGAKAGEAMLLWPARAGSWGAVFRREELLRARREHPALCIRRSAEAAGLTLRRPAADELPFAFDQAMKQGLALEADGSFAEAARIYRSLERAGANACWAGEAAAEALAHDPAHAEQALRAARRINRRRPTPGMLLLQARLCRKNHQVEQAADLLEQARAMLDWTCDQREPTC